jgi:hypothetical protein
MGGKTQIEGVRVLNRVALIRARNIWRYGGGHKDELGQRRHDEFMACRLRSATWSLMLAQACPHLSFRTKK